MGGTQHIAEDGFALYSYQLVYKLGRITPYILIRSDRPANTLYITMIGIAASI
jgi:hypothetical protein